MIHAGGCHCGNIKIEFESEIDPARMDVRACQCDFCRKHGARAIADPDGRLKIKVADDRQLSHYKFGFGTAAFLVCRQCGVYVAAVTAGEQNPRAILMVNTLNNREDFCAPEIAADYDEECRSQRVQRRRENWTPVSTVFKMPR